MLTQLYRPKKLSEVFGQPLPVEVLRSIIKNPHDSPRSLILYGEYGCGKTSCARILARALNCENPTRERDPCGSCPTCKSALDYTPRFQEYDASDMGGVEAIRNLKDELYHVASRVHWRIVVLDEAHLCSRLSQSTLLKLLEEMPTNLFFLFCTTELDKMIPTIRSRSIELPFRAVGLSFIRENLNRIIRLENIDIAESMVEHIALHSKGHFRDSVMMLDLYRRVEDESIFLSTLKSVELEVINLLVMARSGDRENFQKLAGEITECILEGVRSDFYLVVRNAIKLLVMDELESVYKEPYQVLVSLYGQDLFKVLRYVASPWAATTFQSDLALQAFFWSLFYTFSAQPGATPTSSLVSRAKKRKPGDD
jgi:DNA polymerase III subunit gamma/tau